MPAHKLSKQMNRLLSQQRLRNKNDFAEMGISLVGDMPSGITYSRVCIETARHFFRVNSTWAYAMDTVKISGYILADARIFFSTRLYAPILTA
jgi:hypothetical protein